MANASGAVARASRQPRHVTTWLTPRHPHANRPFPAGEMLADPPPLKGRGSAHHRNSLNIVGHRQQPVSPPTRTSQWLFRDWGVRARARESQGQPLGRPPSQGPPRCVIPDEAAAVRSRSRAPPERDLESPSSSARGATASPAATAPSRALEAKFVPAAV